VAWPGPVHDHQGREDNQGYFCCQRGPISCSVSVLVQSVLQAYLTVLTAQPRIMGIKKTALPSLKPFRRKVGMGWSSDDRGLFTSSPLRVMDGDLASACPGTTQLTYTQRSLSGKDPWKSSFNMPIIKCILLLINLCWGYFAFANCLAEWVFLVYSLSRCLKCLGT